MSRIRRLELLDDAGNAAGWTVVIDVFRAFTIAPLAFASGARRIHPVAPPEDALALNMAHPDWLLTGERERRPLPGCDFGNSPAEIVVAARR